jgi:hypothetical protein
MKLQGLTSQAVTKNKSDVVTDLNFEIFILSLSDLIPYPVSLSIFSGYLTFSGLALLSGGSAFIKK